MVCAGAANAFDSIQIIYSLAITDIIQSARCQNYPKLNWVGLGRIALPIFDEVHTKNIGTTIYCLELP